MKIKCKIPKHLFDLCNENIYALRGTGETIENFIKLENKAKDKENHFYVGRDQYINLFRNNKNIIGFIHNHCPFHNSEPSEKDIKSATNYINLVIKGGIIHRYSKNGIVYKFKIKSNPLDRFLVWIFSVL